MRCLWKAYVCPSIHECPVQHSRRTSSPYSTSTAPSSSFQRPATSTSPLSAGACSSQVRQSHVILCILDVEVVCLIFVCTKGFGSKSSIIVYPSYQGKPCLMSALHKSVPYRQVKLSLRLPIRIHPAPCAGHVMLNRVDRRSQLECLTQCRRLLQRGASVLFFPEGTRSKDRRLQEFKKARLVAT